MNFFTLPSLRIVKQTSLATEKFARNGEQKDIHVVVKNSPFVTQVEFQSPTENYNFNTIRVEPQLVYDCEEKRIVDFIKHTPLEFKALVSECATQVSLEIRIKVLSSQLEDMLFRIKMVSFDVATDQPLPKLSVISEPIRVVSKPEQVFRKTPQKRTLKKTLSEKMAETMHALQENQIKQTLLLKQVLSAQQSSVQEDVFGSLLGKRTARPTSPPSLEVAFSEFMSVFLGTDSLDRPQKIRKFIRECTDTEAELLGELLGQVHHVIYRENTQVAASPVSATHLNAMNLFPFNDEVITPRFFESLSSGPLVGIRS
jgi:hypothetical protein